MRLQVDIYENQATTPILTHIFYGKDKNEIDGVVKAHMQTDSFFRAALTTRTFQDITLTAV
ncbi:MAG: hypothetical protein ACREQ5_06175, partial [Candidatus Dormibacteria bacterium]